MGSFRLSAGIIPSDEDIVDVSVKADILIEFHSKDLNANVYLDNRDIIIKSMQEAITSYYQED